MSELATLSDMAEIAQAKARYCRTLDTKDWAAFAELMTADIVLDVSGDTGQPAVAGRDKVVDYIRKAVQSARTAHQVHHPEITIRGDQAEAIWPMQDRIMFDDGSTLTGYGHYHERWVRHAGSWKLSALTLTRLLTDFGRISAES